MKIIYDKKRSGKTHKIIKECAEEGGYIVCPTMEQVDVILNRAKIMGLNIPQPITFREFIQGKYYGKGINKFYIDNLDQCIQNITVVPIKTVTLTKDDTDEG